MFSIVIGNYTIGEFREKPCRHTEGTASNTCPRSLRFRTNAIYPAYFVMNSLPTHYLPLHSKDNAEVNALFLPLDFQNVVGVVAWCIGCKRHLHNC